ncbi:HAD-IA family hydrolase [Methylolobus aquaticus]
MMVRRFDLLVFDWDGTLLDSVDWIVECLQNAALESGLPVPTDPVARSVIGLSLDEALKAAFPGMDGERIGPLMEAYRRHFFTRQLTAADLFDGVSDMLGELRDAGFRLAIATGKARRGLDHALEQTGVGPFFETTRCADETASKPDPAMLHEILAVTGIAPHRAVMIGDSIHDLRMAANAGIAGIAVTSGANNRAELTEMNPLGCLNRVVDLPAILHAG